MSKSIGDLAIVAVFSFYLWGGLLATVVAVVGAHLLRVTQAKRFARIAAAPAEASAGEDFAVAEQEFDAAIRAAQHELRDLPAGTDQARRAVEEQALWELARVDALYDQLGALRSASTASYTPVVAGLHDLAAEKGLEGSRRSA
jgi:hypothetical protein